MRLTEIVEQWQACEACALHRFRRHVVVGEAFQAEARIEDPLVLIVGEAPGRVEDETGRPFCGPAGRVLREDMLAATGLRLAYITNLCACRPAGNRDPHLDELDACTPRLADLVQALAPDALLCVGRFAAGNRGQWRLHFDDKPTAAILHPAALLRAGYPNAATRRKLKVQTAKIKRLLAKLGVKDKVEEGPTCEHEYVNGGQWTRTDGSTEPLRACQHCGLMEG